MMRRMKESQINETQYAEFHSLPLMYSTDRVCAYALVKHRHLVVILVKGIPAGMMEVMEKSKKY